MTTLTGTIKVPSGTAYVGYITFVPVTAPGTLSTTTFVSSNVKVKCTVDGIFSVSLAPLTYDAVFETTELDKLRFVLPDSVSTQDIATLAAAYNPGIVITPA